MSELKCALPVVKAELVNVGEDGSDRWVLMVNVELGVLRVEYEIDVMEECTAKQWNKFFTEETGYVGPSAKHAWITKYLESEGMTCCELAGIFNPKVGLRVDLPSDILLPILRPVVDDYFEKTRSKVSVAIGKAARANQ